MRKWLQRNKVFFETVGILAIAALGLVIAIEANKITRLQTEIQRKLTLLQTPPLVDLTPWRPGFIPGFDKENEAEKVTYNSFQISIFGGPIYDVDVIPIIFIELLVGVGTDSDCIVSITMDEMEFSVKDEGNIQNNIMGVNLFPLLLVKESEKPFSKYIEGQRKNFNVNPRGRFRGEVFISVYLKINYRDSYSRELSTYFSIFDDQGHTRITQSQWNGVRRKIQQLRKNGLKANFDEYREQALVKLWKNYDDGNIDGQCRPRGYGELDWRSLKTN